MLSVGSLFAGIGGFDLGLERAGMRVAWQCEADPFCRRVLTRHWPGVPCYPDLRELRGPEVEAVDVLCGGFPCQDISLAGAGVGIAGARSGLWSEYARLIGELRPRYVIVENVAALLARGLDVVLADLAAIGYDAEWDCIPASAVGAPHRRDRLWLVAYPAWDGATRVRAQTGAERQRVRPSGEPGRARDVSDAYDEGEHALAVDAEVAGAPEHVADTEIKPIRAGLCESEPREVRRGRPGDSGSAEEWWLAEPDVGRVAHGIPARMDRLRSLGNALVPQIAEWLGRRILDYERRAA